MCDSLHPFEEAGLGESPFRLIGITKNVYSAAPGHQQPGGTCQYCFQGIMYECLIQSKDGKQFTVGCDCVRKLDRADNRLVDAVKRAKLKIERAEREAKREAARAERDRLYQLELDAQRLRNGGLTDREVEREAHRQAELAKAKAFAEANDWLVRILEREYQSEFIRGMIEQVQRCPIGDLSPRCQTILCGIYGKAHGRRGSKKYDAAVAEFESKAEATNAL